MVLCAVLFGVRTTFKLPALLIVVDALDLKVLIQFTRPIVFLPGTPHQTLSFRHFLWDIFLLQKHYVPHSNVTFVMKWLNLRAGKHAPGYRLPATGIPAGIDENTPAPCVRTYFIKLFVLVNPAVPVTGSVSTRFNSGYKQNCMLIFDVLKHMVDKTKVGIVFLIRNFTLDTF